MSLLKALQINLTNISIPWTPRPSASLARFINEIVHAEESDINEKGEPKSHFEMYLDAMEECGANTNKINKFVNNVSKGKLPEVNKAIDSFLATTFDVLNSGEAHKIAAAFTFGREDLIPDMFIEIVKKLSNEKEIKADLLIYYLDRHIELDADEHGPMALKMIQNLCGNDPVKWKEATTVSYTHLRAHET